jgi:hypothetical protein
MPTSGATAAGSPGASGDIIRTNPYGTAPANTQKQQPNQTGQMLQKMGDQMQQNSKQPDAQISMNTGSIGSTYGALFGNATQVGNYGGGQMGVQAGGGISTPQMQAPPASLAPPMQPIAPPPQAAPMQLGVSDRRAKTNIYKGNKDLERLLDRVYTQFTSKGKR